MTEDCKQRSENARKIDNRLNADLAGGVVLSGGNLDWRITGMTGMTGLGPKIQPWAAFCGRLRGFYMFCVYP